MSSAASSSSAQSSAGAVAFSSTASVASASSEPNELYGFGLEHGDTGQGENATSFHWHTGKLYGRSKEGSMLIQTYQRVMANQDEAASPVLIAISGNDGVGKSVVAQTLRKPVLDDGGYLIRGKFDRLLRANGIAAFVSAFEEFTNIIMHRTEVDSIREAISNAIPDDETKVLLDTMPSLKHIVRSRDGREHQLQETTKTRLRFAIIFRKFIAAICSRAYPLVLVLDDLHLADQCSLDLLASLIPDVGHKGMLFVVTYKDLGPTSPVSKLMSRLEHEDVSISSLVLSNLQTDVVNSLVADVLELPPMMTKNLAQLIYHDTGGNPLFVLEFIRTLEERGLLRFDTNQRRWVADDHRIYLEMEGYRAGDLILERMNRQPKALKDLLTTASCLGSKLNELLLGCAISDSTLTKLLDVGAEQGFFLYNWDQDDFDFAHDCVQKAAYMLIPPKSRSVFHVSIGRKLRKNLNASELDRNIYVVLTQFRLGADGMKSYAERIDIANLCLRAAEKALSASSFPTASLYLDFGIELLGERGWNEEYELSLALHNTAAEMEYYAANFPRVLALVSNVFDNGRSFKDKLRAHFTEVHVLCAMDKTEVILNTGLEVLRGLGEPIHLGLSNWRLSAEMGRIQRILRDKSDETLLSLPLMTDSDKLAAMKMLNLIFLGAYVARPQLATAVILRMMHLTLELGLGEMTSSAFVLYGLLLCKSSRDVDEGYRFGRLALTLLDDFKVNEWIPRVYAWMYAGIFSWKRPFRLSLEPLRTGLLSSLEFGDIEYSTLNASIYCVISLDAGTPLNVIQSDLKSLCETMIEYRQLSALAVVRPFQSFLQNLVGQSHDLIDPHGLLRFDEASTLSETKQMKNSVKSFSINFQRTVLAYLFGDYVLASRLIKQCRHILQHPLASLESLAAVAYFDSLAALALALSAATQDRAGYLALSRRYVNMLKKWSRESPHNCLDRLFLVQAEQAAVMGDNKRAYAKYLVAIAVSQEEGHLHIESMATERAGRHLLRVKDFKLASQFLQRSHESYLEWGAKLKASNLKDEFTDYIQ